MPVINLYPYQKKWLSDQSKYKCWLASRQVGKSFTCTLEIVDDCFQSAVEGRRSRWVILSRGERQAKELIEEGVKRHAKAYQLAIESIEYDWIGTEGTYKALEVILPGGSKITALPCNPDTARGYSASVFIDEYALVKDSKEIWGAMFPIISAGHKIRIASTPRGKENKFYEIMTLEDPIWSKHVTDIYEAVHQGLPRDIGALKRALNDDDIWAQEFELKWLDQADSWLSYDLINGVEDEKAGIPGNYQGGPCFIGNDIGRRHDLWVAWVWEVVGDVLWCREIVTMKQASFAEQDDVLDDLMRRYQVVRVAIDQTGMGECVVENAKRRYGEYRIEGVVFTAPSKQHLAILGKQAFEDKKVRIPMGNSELRTDLHKLKKIISPLGNVRFDADADGNGHCDRAWAAFLGIYAAGAQARAILPDFGFA